MEYECMMTKSQILYLRNVRITHRNIDHFKWKRGATQISAGRKQAKLMNIDEFKIPNIEEKYFQFSEKTPKDAKSSQLI